MLGGLICAKYGNPSADAQLKLLSQKLGAYLHEQGVRIPKSPDTAMLARKGGVIDTIEKFFYTYPTEILNTGYAIGGVQLLRSGLQHNKIWDTASGALVAAGALSGLLIKEKKPDLEHPPKGVVAKTIAAVHEKPLRLSGTLYDLNNITLAMSAINEMRANPAQKSYLFKFLTVAVFVFGNSMLSLTSKQNPATDKEGLAALSRLEDAAARVITAQPEPLQEALVQQISGFLAAQPEVTLTGDQIAGMLHRNLAQHRVPDTRVSHPRVLAVREHEITPSPTL